MALPAVSIALTYSLVEMQFGSGDGASKKGAQAEGNDAGDRNRDAGRNQLPQQQQQQQQQQQIRLLPLVKEVLQVGLLLSAPFIATLPQGVFFYWIPSTCYVSPVTVACVRA